MGRSLLALLAALLLIPACFDDAPDPTQGFLEIDAGGVANVEVFVDGLSQGTVTRVGPLDAGLHAVRVERAGYEVSPPSQDVEIRPARTFRAQFTLTLAFTGSVHVTAVDELRGTAVTGAQILVDTGAGPTATGVTTPGTVTGLPPGDVDVVVRRDGFEDTDPIGVEIEVGMTDEVEAVLGPRRAVLAEMFTYSICPNCPASAEHLWGMYQANPGRFFAIEWHVLPTLPLYDATGAARELDYGGGNAAGRPAVVFQGGAFDDPVLVLSSTASALAEYDNRFAAQVAACRNDCGVAMVLDGTITATSADVTVRAKWRSGVLPPQLELWVVLTENDVTGVSPANTDHFSFVPRAHSTEPVSFAAPGEILTSTMSFPVQAGWEVGDLVVVAYIQSESTREIVAVAGLP